MSLSFHRLNSVAPLSLLCATSTIDYQVAFDQQGESRAAVHGGCKRGNFSGLENKFLLDSSIKTEMMPLSNVAYY